MELDKEAHRKIAVSLNGEVWSLLEKESRDEAENRRMVSAAHASAYHWLHAGTAVNEQRGEWLLGRVYTVLEVGEAAKRHAERCAELTEEHGKDLKDFDLAFSAESLARALALLGSHDAAAKLKQRARELGNDIADPEDKKIFDADFAGGPWFGVD